MHLQSFATDEAIRYAIIALHEVQQKPSEDDMEYYIRVTELSSHFRNFYAMDEQMVTLIEGLDSSIMPWFPNIGKITEMCPFSGC